MNLDDTQKKQVSAWIAEGLKLSEIQKRMESDLGIRMTYMEVRLLVDDLKLTPKDAEPAKPAEVGPKQLDARLAARQGNEVSAPPGQPQPNTGGHPPLLGGVAVTLDQQTRPGALASGAVTFSDGATAKWYLDQLGRLGLIPQQSGYKPSASDLQTFHTELQNQLQNMGF